MKKERNYVKFSSDHSTINPWIKWFNGYFYNVGFSYKRFLLYLIFKLKVLNLSPTLATIKNRSLYLLSFLCLLYLTKGFSFLQSNYRAVSSIIYIYSKLKTHMVLLERKIIPRTLGIRISKWRILSCFFWNQLCNVFKVSGLWSFFVFTE